jgi:hypothetical protein
MRINFSNLEDIKKDCRDFPGKNNPGDKGKCSTVPYLVFLKSESDSTTIRILYPYTEGKKFISFFDKDNNVYHSFERDGDIYEMFIKYIRLPECPQELLDLLEIEGE